jgi:hypothetical protein
VTAILVSDTHLTDRPNDEYRWGLWPWLREQVKRVQADEIVHLGDLTDAKDRHPARLVNRLVESTALVTDLCHLYFLKGNHDYIDPLDPFFAFVGGHIKISYCKIPTVAELSIGKATFVPAGEIWNFQLHDFPYCFTHVTFDGAEAENGSLLPGVDPARLKDYAGMVYCVTEGHEVLTKSGWVDISTTPDEIAVWDDGAITFETPLRWNVGEADDLISVTTRAMSIVGTREHQMPVVEGSGVGKRCLDELPGTHDISPGVGTYDKGTKSVEHVQLIAAFQADGHRDRHGDITWTFGKQRKIDRLRALLEASGLRFSEYPVTRGYTRFLVHRHQGQESWPKHCGAEILEWNNDSLEDFCESHLWWDASVGQYPRIEAKSKEHLEWLAVAYMCTGRMIRVTKLVKPRGMYWRLSLRNNSVHGFYKSEVDEVPGAHKVYCPTVRSGFFMMRREGKVFVSGNSGDIHVPQKVRKNIEYVGAPYHIRFGDTFTPRVLVVYNNGKTNELHYPAPRKIVFSLDNPKGLDRLIAEPGDHVRIRYHLRRSDYDTWHEVRERIRQYATERGWVLFGVEAMPIETKERDRSKVDELLTPDQLFDDYAKRHKLSEEYIRIGRELLL